VSVLPIAELNHEAAQAILAVAFDVDDTVTEEGVLDPSAYAAMHRLRAAGLLLVAATGRPVGFAEIIARTWPVHAAVGENGAGYVVRSGRAVRRCYWDDDAERAAQRAQLDTIARAVSTVLPHVRVSSDGWARACDLAFDVGEEVALPAHDVARLTALIEAHGAHATVSSIHAHAQLGRHDKATGIAWVLEREHNLAADAARAQCLFVGDSGNDAAAFAWFEHTVGVANVQAHLGRLPVPPRYVTTASHGRGFSELAEVLIARREAP
jgi:HAD superfamily hydrolase (TIGR01484 family)